MVLTQEEINKKFWEYTERYPGIFGLLAYTPAQNKDVASVSFSEGYIQGVEFTLKRLKLKEIIHENDSPTESPGNDDQRA